MHYSDGKLSAMSYRFWISNWKKSVWPNQMDVWFVKNFEKQKKRKRRKKSIVDHKLASVALRPPQRRGWWEWWRRRWPRIFNQPTLVRVQNANILVSLGKQRTGSLDLCTLSMPHRLPYSHWKHTRFSSEIKNGKIRQNVTERNVYTSQELYFLSFSSWRLFVFQISDELENRSRGKCLVEWSEDG